MLILIRLLTLITPLVSAASFWFVFRSLPVMFTLQAISLVLTFVSFWQINKLNEKKEWQPLIITEVFLLSMYLLSLLMERRIFLTALSLLTLMVMWAWLEIHFKKNFKGELMAEGISYKSITFLIYASFFTSIYGLREFIVTPVWVLCIIVIAVYLSVFNQHLVVTSDFVSRWKQVGCATLIQLQLFLIFLALPLPYYAKGALLVSSFYFINRVFDAYRNQKNSIKIYLIEVTVFLCLLMLILLTTKW
jgi:hypothetical protein